MNPQYIDPDWIEPLQDLANEVCRYLPEGCELSINFESGAAGITLLSPPDSDGHYIHDGYYKLPDSADKSLAEQLNDALLVANGVIKL